MTDATKTVLTEEEQHKLFWARGEDVMPWWAVTIYRLAHRLALAEAVADAAKEGFELCVMGSIVNNKAWCNTHWQLWPCTYSRFSDALAAYDAGTR